MSRPDFIALQPLLSRGRPSDTVIAVGAEGPKTWGDLRRAADKQGAAFAASAQPRFALYQKDSWEFMGALLGIWSAGKQVTLLGEASFAAELTGPASALSLCTSGTTGRPLVVAKSFSQLDTEIAALESLFGAEFGDAAVLATVSHQHIYGLLFKILWPLCAGRVIYLDSLFYPEEVLEAASSRGSVALITSPAHLKRLPEALDWSAAAGRWRAIVSSGGPLPFDAAQRTRRAFGRAPLEIYGSTETGGIAWRERMAENDPWRLFPQVAIKVDAASGALSVRSPHLPDDRWHATGDRGGLTEGGLELLGRLDRIAKVEEKRVSLTGVEEALTASGLAAQARVLLLPSTRDELGAVVVLSPEGLRLDSKTVRERLRAALAGAVAGVAIPRRWRFVADLPLDAQGKVSENALKALFVPAPRLPDVASLKHDAGAAELLLRLPRDLVYFSGHFPVAPILPGVVQIDWAVHFAKRHLGLRGEFRRIEALKFHHVLQPGDEPELRLGFDADKGRLKFEYRTSKGRHSSGVLLFRASHA